MTGKDKAQEKLVASIRKTKQGAIDNKADIEPEVKNTAKSNVRKKSGRSTVKKALPRGSHAGYQSGKRVWPD